MTEEELKGYVNDNPDLWFYQLVYGLTFAIMLFIGLMKGIGIARQLLLGKLMQWISTVKCTVLYNFFCTLKV
jgi:hypothetical protein